MSSRLFLVAVLLLLLGVASTSSGSSSPSSSEAAASGPPPLLPEVFIDLGLVRGSWEASLGGRPIAAFRGIPYAKPPVGKHRFKEPVAGIPWQGVLNATLPPPECLQLDHFHLDTNLAVHGSEDCLYLSVFTPKIPRIENVGTASSELLDVIVYIHGGAFMFHTSGPYEPTVLLDRDLVLVTVNYRLGPLGFLSTEDTVVSGNNGMKDQVMALKWVQSHISGFGGDPKRVTLAGMSAGGASVHYHLLSPLSKGLFHRAIMVSGISLNPWARAEAPLKKAQYLAHGLGCPVNDSLSMVRCLRSRPANHILQLTSHFMEFLYNPFSPFGPTLEPEGPNAFLSEEPLKLLSSGLAHDLPILASFTTEEGLYPGADILGREAVMKMLNAEWPRLAPHLLDFNWTLPIEKHAEVAQRIKEHYQVDLNNEEGIKNFVKLLSDRLFVHGIVKGMKLHAVHGTSPAYLFRFAYKGNYTTSSIFTDKYYGVSHADDIFYILPTSFTHCLETEQDRRMARILADVWADFARDGKLGEPWKEVQETLIEDKFLELRGLEQLELVADPHIGEETFWDGLGLQENIILPSNHDEL